MLGERTAPEDVKLIESRCVYNIKGDWTEKITKRKSRLVALGYQQKQGVDYEEIFAPMAKPTPAQAQSVHTSIRCRQHVSKRIT